MKRVCIYIDGANFYGGLTSINPSYSDLNFDFEKYIKKLCGEDVLVRIYYYNAFVKKKVNFKVWEKQNKLFAHMHSIPKVWVKLCTRKSRLNILGEEYYTIKGDDICLALDVIEDCYNDVYDKCILISGDGDFVELLKRIKKKGKEIEVCYFQGCVSKPLLKMADKVSLVNKKMVNKFFYRGRRK